jgi:hypothetical protein
MSHQGRAKVTRSAVVIMLGDLLAFWASSLIFGDVIAAGVLAIQQFYGASC